MTSEWKVKLHPVNETELCSAWSLFFFLTALVRDQDSTGKCQVKLLRAAPRNTRNIIF